MKRNWDTVRRILIAVEQLPDEASQISSHELQGIDPDEAAYHMRLMRDAGLITGGCREALGPAWCYATGLTWNGHEFLDRIRNDGTWNRIKTTVRERGADMSFDGIVAVAKWLVEQAL
jgi:hypothetical protein